MHPKRFRIALFALLLGIVGSSLVRAQDAARSLGSVRLPHGVVADGKPLSAGTYTVRLTSDEPSSVVGESAHSERWVEFMKNDAVAGREVATVIANADIGAIAKGPRPPMGGTRVDELKGGNYLRVWIARNGQHYLINLATPRQP